MDSRPIALMTDFGHRDPFVGIMKGVILGINPSAKVIDLCHDLPPGDVPTASFAFAMAYPYLPEDTICAVVIDPGVGTDRRMIAAEIAGRVFVGPDNGILSWILLRDKPSRMVELKNNEYFLPKVSRTFHGRDIFAPVAAHLSNGVSMESLGPAVKDPVTFPVPQIAIGDQSIQGEVVYIDRFGNLLTNITLSDFERWKPETPDGGLKIHMGSVEILGISRAYGDVPKGHAVAVFGSSGVLEIGMNGGNASIALGATTGSHVLIYQLPG